MACQHKFYEDLNLDRLDFMPEVLIVGTFNPSWPSNNQADWFYGRTKNNYFWDVLPAMYNEASLRNLLPEETLEGWKTFCKTHKIALTDLISTIKDADQTNLKHVTKLGGYLDSELVKNFNDFELTNVIDLLKKHKSIKSVYLTTKAQIPFFNEIWDNIEAYCLENNIHCRRLLTPSGSARYQIPKGYVPKFPIYKGVLANYIIENWKGEWH